MLYLLKASRVREYHKENLAILCAEEHEQFSVTYSRRWVAPGLTVAPGSGAVIVFADSPYESYVPVRFAQIHEVDDVDERVTVRGVLGPYVCTDEPDALGAAWLPQGNDRPGRSHFLFDAPNEGLRSPQGLDDPRHAWARITTSLRANSFFERSTFARVTRLVDAEGVELDASEGIAVGEEVAVEVDVRRPVDGPSSSVRLSVDPADAVEQVGDAVLVEPGLLRVPVRARHAEADVGLRLDFRPEPLLSCRPSFSFGVRGRASTEGPAAGAADSPVGPSSGAIAGLVRFLEREGDLSDALWLELCEEHLLPAFPCEVIVLEAHARHAEACGQHDKARSALERIEERSPEADEAFLRAALRTGAAELVGDLVDATDISDGRVFGPLIVAASASPPAAVHALVERVLDGEMLGDAKLSDLIGGVSDQITSTDLLARVADRLAYVDPTAAAAMVMARWGQPEDMPEAVLDLLVDWDVERDRIGPYLHHRIGHAAHDGDDAALLDLVAQVRNQGATTQRAELLAAAGRPLLLSEDRETSDRGFDVLHQAARELAANGEPDAALDVLVVLRTHEALWQGNERSAALDEVRDAVEAAIDADDRFIAWERHQQATAYDSLRPKLTNRVLHLVGGWRHDWADELEAKLGVAKLVWHESDKAKSPDHSWTRSLEPDVDIVVVLTDFIGHAYSVPVRDACARKGVLYLHAKQKKATVLEALAEGL